MPTQNLNTYYYPKYKTFLNSRQYFDLTLAADERDYDEEVVFSPAGTSVQEGPDQGRCRVNPVQEGPDQGRC